VAKESIHVRYNVVIAVV